MSANTAWRALTEAWFASEEQALEPLRAELLSAQPFPAASARAAQWITSIRAGQSMGPGVESLLREYPLGSREGLALMVLAESLLRIPDADCADALIRDLLTPGDWRRHVGHSESPLVNATSWGLALAGSWLADRDHRSGRPPTDLPTWLQRWRGRLAEPLLRRALKRGMRHLADQFVLGADLPRALARARQHWSAGTTHSIDMLGEAALTAEDSDRYLQAYHAAIDAVAALQPPAGIARPGISIKLSALHPRYQTQHWQRLQRELLPRLQALVQRANAADIDVTFDAEEADRLELSMALLERLCDGLPPGCRRRIGVAVQAYNPRVLAVLHWIGELAARYDTQFRIRLVKGAYWDSEIKRAQQRGLHTYPVFTAKWQTDLAYLACARWLLHHPHRLLPQFATHNAHSIATILQWQPDPRRLEFQRLHGMGEALYRCVRRDHPDLALRIYAPVGEPHELLPYLIRRLLENSANNAFVHQLHDATIPIERLLQDPLQGAEAPAQPLPAPTAIHSPRQDSAGVWLHSEAERRALLHEINAFRSNVYGSERDRQRVTSPASGELVGYWQAATTAQLERSVTDARTAQRRWAETPVETRAGVLDAVAQRLQARRAELVTLMARETGKTLENGLEEVREAIDFCRYYAALAREQLTPRELPGPNGERNSLRLLPRGLVVSITPWNFPLSIFIGQAAAALVCGNAVIAKPAEQSTLTAQLATQCLMQGGLPNGVLQLLPGDGAQLGGALCAHQSIDGVVFTGSLQTARAIQRTLADRAGPLIPLIAETAGINALIADSSAQPQQLVTDVLRSAFDSAGQRCSALRLLCLPETIADDIERLLKGAMQQLQLGDPLEWSSDIGPIIDAESLQTLGNYVDGYRQCGRLLFQGETPAPGLFLAPALLSVEQVAELEHEAFGPILHILRYDERRLDALVDSINELGYGLTAGIHSRNEARAQRIAAQLQVGNCYINRDMVGAVVGSQPFGGRGCSGTGPKAGGPHYLLAFTTAQTLTINSAALGGDPELFGRPASHVRSTTR